MARTRRAGAFETLHHQTAKHVVWLSLEDRRVTSVTGVEPPRLALAFRPWKRGYRQRVGHFVSALSI